MIVLCQPAISTNDTGDASRFTLTSAAAKASPAARTLPATAALAVSVIGSSTMPMVRGEGAFVALRRRKAGISTGAAAIASRTRCAKTPIVSKLGAKGTSPELDQASVLGLNAAIPQ